MASSALFAAPSWTARRRQGMEAYPMELDDEGLPVFRPDPAHSPEGIDVAAALRLEQEAQ